MGEGDRFVGNEITLFEGAQVLDVERGRAGAGAGPFDRMRAWTEAFALWLDSRRSANTRRAYERAWREFLNFSSKNPWEIVKTDVSLWVDALHRQGLSKCTVAQYVAAISSFYVYARDDYEVRLPDGRAVPLHDANPAASKSLRPAVKAYGKATYLASDEARALLQAIKRTTVQGLRDYALFLTYLATGRRNSEVRNLKWGDFQDSGGRLYYRWSGKGKEDQRFEMPLRVWQAIEAWLKAAGRLSTMQDGDYIFTAISELAGRLPTVQAESWDPFAQPLSMRQVGALLKKYARKAGLDPKKIHVHTLRHTAAMLRKEAGDDVEKICAFLGHSGIAVTQIYLHTVEGQKDTSWSTVEALLGL
jgi:site-specific recombinase XerD